MKFSRISLIIIPIVFVLLGFKTIIVNNTQDQGLLIADVTIISANKYGNIEQYVGFVFINGDTITYCGKQKPSVTQNVRIINGRGKYLIPGLIDSHVHLATVQGMSLENQRKYPTMVAEYFKQLPKSFLYFGYTTLIDVNNYAPRIVEKIKKAKLTPDIYTCGSQVLIMNDFAMKMDELPFPERLNLPFLYDKYNANIRIPDSINLDAHSPTAIVENTVNQQGGIGIKMVYEDEASGFPPTWELPSLSLMRDIVSRTRIVKVPLLFHATSFQAQQFGLNAGVDIFAHSMWNWYSKPEDFLSEKFSKDHQALLKSISSKRLGYQLTFRAICGEADLFNDFFLSSTELANVFPESFLKDFLLNEGGLGKEKLLSRAKIIRSVNPELYSLTRKKFKSDEDMFKGIQQVLIKRINRVAKFLSDNNANLLFGTDGVAMNLYTNPPGYNGFLEMNHWANAGVSLRNIFLAATYRNAKSFTLESKYGIIEKGKIANLLLLNESPLKKVSAYNSISLVVLNGRDFDRKVFSAKMKD